MSFVTLILIKDKQLQIVSAHYCTIKKIVEYCDFGIQTIKTTNKTEIDEGYMLVDCDKKIVINMQNAFSIHDLLCDFEKIIL